MKKVYSAVIFVLLSVSVFSQAPDWGWAKSAQGAYNDDGRGICTDGNGNVYVTGRFNSPTITFGSYVLTNTGGGGETIFLAKYDALGNELWAKSAIGEGESYDVATDVSGNVFITGTFHTPTFVFGSDTLINTGFFTYDVFIAKYDSSGNELWAKGVGGAGYEFSSGICSDSAGNIFVTGQFYSSTITLGSDTFNNLFTGPDIFTIKYDTIGNLIWAKCSVGDGYEGGESVCVDPFGDVFVLGSFGSPEAIFDGDTITNAGIFDFFVVKYSNSGNLLWVKSNGGLDFEQSTSMTIDEIGNVFVTGKFTGWELPLDTDTLINVTGGFYDIFIVKYDNSGNEIWAKSAGGNHDDLSYGISHDTDGNIFIAGMFASEIIVFDTIALTNANVVGSEDIFITKLDNSGNVVWVKTTGNVGHEASYAISVDINGNAFITGEFSSSAVNFGSTNIINAGFSNCFVAKIDKCILQSFSQSASVCDGNSFIVGTQTYTTSGTYIDTLTTVNGCDSILYTYLTVFPFISDTLYFTINSGDSLQILDQIYTSPGIYADTLISAIGCDTIFTIDITLITNINSPGYPEAKMEIYPNPFTSQTIIDLNTDYKNATLKIIDVLGKELKIISFSGKQVILEREELNNGIYFIQIVSEEKLIATNKIIIN